MNGTPDKRKSKPVFIRGLEELENKAEFAELAGDEFPHRKSLLEVDRRSVLKLMGAASALAGLGGCRSLILPQKKVVPFVKQPEDAVSGKTTQYATVYNLNGFGIGVLATAHDSRPTKLEGNPNHPSSLGGLDAQTMAQVVSLYDPDRLQLPKFKGEPTSWSDALAALRGALSESKNGAGFYLLTETVGSPTLAKQVQDFLKVYPAATWVQWEPANRDNAREGLKTAFGQDVHVAYDLAKADVIVSLDSDFLYSGPGAVRYARDTMARRKPGHPDGYNRIYAFESNRTTAGVVADHRARVKASGIARLAGLLASRLGVAGATGGEVAGVDAKLIDALVKDLNASRGKSAVIVGDHQPPEAHALAAAINEHLGNVGTTVHVLEPVLAKPTNQGAEFAALLQAMGTGEAKTLLVLGGNPVYSAYGDTKFADLLAKVPLSATLSLYNDET
ncbi:MAG: TAT-variant-translocated molybdopterin oxidoreductase, partial [Armatimonadetes bacterium]|nr:TAT-variant-translocated molybdopterin oxidoreductase [Armatimonadota bacterium]